VSGFAIRPMVKADEPFIFKAWLEGYWDAGAGGAVLIMRKSEWLPRWHLLIEIILVNPRTCTVVAHVGDKPDSLLGFACGNADCLHWVYVKQPWRHFGYTYNDDGSVKERKPGIGSALIGVVGGKSLCQVSHWPGPELNYYSELWRYAPELLRRYA